MGTRSPRTPCLALLVAVGCDCPSMDGMAVMDPHDLASDEEVEEIYGAFEEFGAWTGVDSVCSLGVKIGRLLPGRSARTTILNGWIKLDEEALIEPRFATRHELCHAWDISRGFVSLDHPDIFEESDVQDHALYPSARLRRMESFAAVCDGGPREVGIELGLEELCGVELLGDRQRFVMREVFAAYESSWPWLGETELALERVALPDEDWQGFTVAGGELFGLALGPVPSSSIGSGYELVAFEPGSGMVTGRWAVPEELRRQDVVSLVGADEDPLLVRVGDKVLDGWRFRRKREIFQRAELGDLWSETGVSVGVVRGDRAWLRVGRALYELDLAAGEAEILYWNEPSDPDNWASPWSVQDLGRELLVNLYTRLVWIDPDVGVGRSVELPWERDVYVMSAVALSDGRVALPMSIQPNDETTVYPVPVLHDPVQGGWRADPASCGADWIGSQGSLPAQAHEGPLLLDDALVFLEWDSGEQRRYLVVLTFP